MSDTDRPYKDIVDLVKYGKKHDLLPYEIGLIGLNLTHDGDTVYTAETNDELHYVVFEMCRIASEELLEETG